MKKSLIALAIAGAVSAPAAFAATSNVDVYGVLNLSVNFVDPDAPLQDSSTSVTSTASRIGFKGAEDLGGGLSAIWQIESGFDADETTGTNTLGSRNTFLGLKGGWGTALAGKHDTPMKMLGRMVDNFGDTLADDRNILGAIANGENKYDARTPNTIAYVSPDFDGFNAVVAYVSDVNSNGPLLDNNDYDAWSVNGTYKNGPLLLGAAYEAHNSPAANSDTDMWRIVGGFDIADFKLAALYEAMSGDSAAKAYERDAYGLFGSYMMGAWTFKANYLNVSDNDVSNDSGADQWTVGVDYSLSKRTTVYGYYVTVDNDINAGYGLGKGAGASDQTYGNYGSSPDSFGIGMRHSF